jgi:hypothetical protein
MEWHYQTFEIWRHLPGPLLCMPCRSGPSAETAQFWAYRGKSAEIFEISRPFTKAAVRTTPADFMFSPGCRPAKTAQSGILSSPPAGTEINQSYQTHHRKHNKHRFPVFKTTSWFTKFKTEHDARHTTSEIQNESPEVHRGNCHARFLIRNKSIDTINIPKEVTEAVSPTTKEANRGTADYISITGKSAVLTVSINFVTPWLRQTETKKTEVVFTISFSFP